MEFFNDVGVDPLKPSLFELIAQEKLRDLLQPALKYVLAVFAQRYPRYLLRIVNKHEEFYATIMFLVESHYLRKHGASFAEHFYGLKRRKRPSIPTDRTQAAVGGLAPGEALNRRTILSSLFFLVVLPYIRAKCSDLYDDLGGNVSADLEEDAMGSPQAGLQVDQSTRGRLGRFFKTGYPWLNLLFEGWLLVYNVGYLFDRTPFYRPWLSWIGVDMRRLGIEDYRATQQRLASSDNPMTIIRRLGGLMLDSLRFLLPTAIFFIKFLEWWYSPSSPARSFASTATGHAIPPPAPLRPHPQGIPLDRSAYGVCPVCHKAIANATALPSGYVYCYRCAYDHIEKHGQCPITLMPAKIWQLRKILV